MAFERHPYCGRWACLEHCCGYIDWPSGYPCVRLPHHEGLHHPEAEWLGR